MKSLDKKSKILVVGLGKRSGLSACNFLAGKGHEVYVSDSKPREELKGVLAGLSGNVKLFEGQDPSLLKEGFDLIVLSPGVPKSIALIQEALKKGVPVIAEVELAYRFMKGYLVAVTGTDGKSTTTSLAGHILSELGIKTFTGGNLGTPFISFVEQTTENSVSVIELSSFQLETIELMKPDAAVILNVTPDHLDRYSGMNEYLGAKLRITMNQGPDDLYVYRLEDERLRNSLGGIKARKLSFSGSGSGGDAFYRDGIIFIKEGGAPARVIDTSSMKIRGIHNVENTMASILMVAAILNRMGKKADYRAIEKACCSFNGLPHRMETVGIFNNRTFINDSKATTVGAVEMALSSVPYGSILIMGGRTKGDDYSRLAGKIKSRIKHLVLIGESAPDFRKLYADVSGEIADSMDDAVGRAIKASSPDDVIILSPACASFDMFKNFEERGDRFREAVYKFNKGESLG